MRLKFGNLATVTGVSHRVKNQIMEAVKCRHVVVTRVVVSAIRTNREVIPKKDPYEGDLHAKCAGTMT